jgi:uncharacterized Zn finger protein
VKTKQVEEMFARCNECGTVDKLRKMPAGWEIVRHEVDGFGSDVCKSSNTDNYDPDSAETRAATYGSF